jgi:uncharacterized oxidoreductase
MRMTGNTIFITGGNAGIGRALAEALHAKGNKVIVAGRRQEALDEVAAANPGIETVVLDMTDAAAIRDVAARLVADFPDLNVVVQNAGIMQPEQVAADDWSLDTTEATIATNLLGPIRLTAALLPHLKGRDAATIMTVSSGLAFVPLAATPAYSATKAAIHSWSQALRTQLAETAIEVIELAPPAVATDLMPGHAENPQSMPLDAFTDEVMTLLEQGGDEVLVERVKPLRFAEASGDYAQVYQMLNTH